MQSYDVYVQDKFFATLSGEYTSDVLNQVTNAIQNGDVPDFDPDQPHSIRLEPK
jgi:hypothetical protein